MRLIFLLLIITGLIEAGCKSKSAEILIFHAGSLSVPFKELSDAYERKNPEVRILMEPAGSLVCARKITELKKPCDIIASADYFVINELLIPDHASWSIKFATNEMVIAFQEKSRYSNEIDSTNWMDILLKDDVTFARSDPDSDPCGYRSVFTMMLAEQYYDRPGLSEKLASKNREFIRPKEVDLIALIESNAADYMFQYKSVAIQHELNYIELPVYINLSDPGKNEIYQSVALDVTASSPGSKMTVTGEYINYSLTILNDAPNKARAIDFVAFLLGEEGMAIFEKNGQAPINPSIAEHTAFIPGKILKILKQDKL